MKFLMNSILIFGLCWNHLHVLFSSCQHCFRFYFPNYYCSFLYLEEIICWEWAVSCLMLSRSFDNTWWPQNLASVHFWAPGLPKFAHKHNLQWPLELWKCVNHHCKGIGLRQLGTPVFRASTPSWLTHKQWRYVLIQMIYQVKQNVPMI